MKSFNLEATTTSPKIYFGDDGILLMEGRSLPEDVNRIFDPVISFAQQLELDELKCNINLEYFNTSSSKKILDLFKHLDANRKLQKIRVNWYYEEGDEDSLEIAEIYEESLRRTEFRYHQFLEAEKPVYDA